MHSRRHLPAAGGGDRADLNGPEDKGRHWLSHGGSGSTRQKAVPHRKPKYEPTVSAGPAAAAFVLSAVDSPVSERQGKGSERTAKGQRKIAPHLIREMLTVYRWGVFGLHCLASFGMGRVTAEPAGAVPCAMIAPPGPYIIRGD